MYPRIRYMAPRRILMAVHGVGGGGVKGEKRMLGGERK